MQKTTLPYEDNYLDLHPTVKDPLGDPVVRITADHKDNEKRVAAFVQDKMEQWFLEAGAVATLRQPVGTMGVSTHAYGGTRMGDDPETNVVDRWGFCHEVPNLGVLGASVMGTSGARNPTLTAQALAWRTAERLVAELAHDRGLTRDVGADRDATRAADDAARQRRDDDDRSVEHARGERGGRSRARGAPRRTPAGAAHLQFNYTSPLHFAVREGHVALVKELVAAGAFDPSYKSYPFGDDLLTMARDREYDEIVGILEDAARNPELAKTWSETGNIDYRQDTKQARFDRALHDSKLREVDRLLTARPDLATNELSSWAEGVLMMPAKKRDFRVLELLLRRGAQVPDLSKWGRFYYFKHADVAQLLLESGMSARHQTWQRVTLLHDMAQSGDLAKARLLLDHGAEIDAVDDEYRSTPLGFAARWGQTAMVAWLLERGADANRAGAQWSTPLAWARKKGHGDIERALVAAGAA